MDTRPQKELVEIEGSLSENNLRVVTKPSYADHPLVVGPRYNYMNDFKFTWAHYPSWVASGIMVGGIGPKGKALAHKLRDSNLLRTYEVDILFGKTTMSGYDDKTRIIEKATYKHIKLPRFNKVLVTVQEMQKSMIYKAAGVSSDTQEGYELAAAGPSRPVDNKTTPLVYGLRCTRFDLPHATLRFNVINENPVFFADIVQRLGFSLKSTACILKLRCVRYGMFQLENALLAKHWTLEHIADNISECYRLMDHDKIITTTSALVKPEELSSRSEILGIDDEEGKDLKRLELI